MTVRTRVIPCLDVADTVTPIVTQVAADGVACFTTYQLSVSLSTDIHNIHSMYGDSENPMVIPAAFQQGELRPRRATQLSLRPTYAP